MIESEKKTGVRNRRLAYFKVEKLFGYKDVHIAFEDNVRILVGENGTGKTTILTLLYCALSCNFTRLRLFDFESVTIGFSNGKVVNIRKSELAKSKISNLRKFSDAMPPHVRYALASPDRPESFAALRSFRNQLAHRVLPDLGPTQQAELLYEISRFIEADRGKQSSTVQRSLYEQIKEGLGDVEICYFPTYRRIEEDLRKLGNSLDLTDHEDNTVIQFGMEDVKRRFNDKSSAIKNSAIDYYSKLTGQMLTQLVHGIPSQTAIHSHNICPDAVRIVLNRVGTSVSDLDKHAVDTLIKTGNIYREEHRVLVYFLARLVEIYDNQHRALDDLIKRFARTCNEYLENKQVVYDEQNVAIDVIRKIDGQAIDLSTLSSGEKQIVSLFSKLYLESGQNLIVLFDEPELSLSIEWQRKLLPDMLSSGKCDLIFAVTHSPFIFDNELDSHALGIGIIAEDKDGPID